MAGAALPDGLLAKLTNVDSGTSPASMQGPVMQPLRPAASPSHVWQGEAWPMRRTNAADEASLSAWHQSARIRGGKKG